MRASGDTQVISPKIMPAPPSARLPKWTRWKSFGTPSAAQYIAIGDMTMRFCSDSPRTRYGVNIGGTGGPSGSILMPARAANQRS